MPVEIVLVRVPVEVGHPHAGDARLQQASGQQAVLAEFVLAVALVIGGRFLRQIENLATLHQRLGLLEGRAVRINRRGSRPRRNRSFDARRMRIDAPRRATA